jgi:GNAT superfamily N-acetyltransferase
MRVLDLEPGDERLNADLLPVLRELRPHLTEASFASIYAQGHPQGLRFTAVYDDEDRCVAVAGWRVVAETFSGRKLTVDDLVTTADRRSEGFGRALLSHLLERAAREGCAYLDLDSATHRKDAHRFYEREGMKFVAHHFAKKVGGSD